MGSSWQPSDEPGREREGESRIRRGYLPIPNKVTESLDTPSRSHLRLLQRYEKIIFEHLLDVDYGAHEIMTTARGVITDSLDSLKKKFKVLNRLELVIKIINSLSRG
jgi:hypothetical protein